MIAHAWFTAAALAAAPVPASPGDSALALYNKGSFLEAADAAITGYVSPAVPAARRMKNARLAQESLSKAYETSAVTEARPEYLCRALDVLDATAPLAVTPEDIRLHTVFVAQHRATLAKRHPAHTCETGTELRPILTNSRTRVPAPVLAAEPGRTESVGPITTSLPRKYAAPASLKIAGAVSLSMAGTAFALMAGGVGLQSHAMRAARSLNAAQKSQDGILSDEQARALVPLAAANDIGRRVALAGGISGAVLLVLGATLFGRGHVLATRARVSPIVGPGQVGLFVHGRF